nr:cell division protein FtsH [Anaerolineae bacterium]
MNANWRKNGLVYILIVVAVAVLFYSASQSADRPEDRSLTEVAGLISDGQVNRIVVAGDQLTVQLKDKTVFVSQKEEGVNLTTSLARLGVTPEQLTVVELKVAPPSDMSGWLTILGTVLPLILIGGLFLMILRQAQGSNSQAMSFGKSRARVFTGDKPTVTFADVAGAEEAKQELQEV